MEDANGAVISGDYSEYIDAGDASKQVESLLEYTEEEVTNIILWWKSMWKVQMNMLISIQ